MKSRYIKNIEQDINLLIEDRNILLKEAYQIQQESVDRYKDIEYSVDEKDIEYIKEYILGNSLKGTVKSVKGYIKNIDTLKRVLQEANIPFLFVTNNATKTPQQVADNLRENYGVEVTKNEVYTSGVAAMDFLDNQNFGKKLMIVGEEALKTQAVERGYELVGENPDVVFFSTYFSKTGENLI